MSECIWMIVIDSLTPFWRSSKNREKFITPHFDWFDNKKGNKVLLIGFGFGFEMDVFIHTHRLVLDYVVFRSKYNNTRRRRRRQWKKREFEAICMYRAAVAASREQIARNTKIVYSLLVVASCVLYRGYSVFNFVAYILALLLLLVVLLLLFCSIPKCCLLKVCTKSGIVRIDFKSRWHTHTQDSHKNWWFVLFFCNWILFSFSFYFGFFSCLRCVALLIKCRYFQFDLKLFFIRVILFLSMSLLCFFSVSKNKSKNMKEHPTIRFVDDGIRCTVPND